MNANYHNWLHEADYYNWAGEPVHITSEWAYKALNLVLVGGITALVVLILAGMISSFFYKPKLTKKQILAIARILEAEKLKETKLS